MQLHRCVTKLQAYIALNICPQGRNGICDMLLTHGAAINAPDKHGMTPLHEAAYKNNERTYQMLCLNKNVDLSLTDTFGNTPEKYFEL